MPDDPNVSTSGTPAADAGAGTGAAATAAPEGVTPQAGAVTDPSAGAQPTRPDWLNPRYQTIEDQAKAYAEAERAMHETNQKATRTEQYARDLEQNHLLLQGQVAALSAKVEEATKPREPEWKPEEIDPDLWTTDPQKAAEIMLKNNLTPVARELTSLKQERELTRRELEQAKRQRDYESDLGGIQDQIGDQNFRVIYPIMQQVVKENPHLLSIPKSAEAVFNMALGIAARTAPAVKQTATQQAVDKAKLADDPEVRNLVLTKYAKEIKDGAPPTVISGAQVAGQPPASPQNRAKSLKEATANIMSRFKK